MPLECSFRKLIFPVSVCCDHFIMENIPALKDVFHFIEILQFMHILSRGMVRDGRE